MPSVHLYGGPFSGSRRTLNGWPPYFTAMWLPPEEARSNYWPESSSTARSEAVTYMRVLYRDEDGTTRYRYMHDAVAPRFEL